MEKKQVAISPTEFVVRQILVWAIFNHPRAHNLYAANSSDPNIKQLFFVLNKEETKVTWNETVILQLPTEDLMGIFIACERTPDASPAEPKIHLG